MDSLSHRLTLRLALCFAALVGCIILLTRMYGESGFSAAWLWLLVVGLWLTGSLFAQFRSQHRQWLQIIRALANGDSTLGLASHHPMRRYVDQVKNQMQSARFEAEQQAQFLKTLMVHIDLAVVVCDASGKVIESNPAVARLLGKPVRTLADLDEIGQLIDDSNENLRTTVQWHQGEQQDTLSMQLSVAEIQGQIRKVITLHSIRDQLLSREQQAYKRLTKVLTHEVANSITPLASIAETARGLLPADLSFRDEESKEDLALALDTLGSRTRHLGEFIESFRQISKLPRPNLAPAPLAPLLERLPVLFGQQLKSHRITLELDIRCQPLVMIDSAQIEQVLINLLQNAIEAVQTAINQGSDTSGRLILTLAQNGARQLYIDVADNGTGIADHVAEMIFVPFYTTRPQGSGIGLSLSRQIMLNHGGDLLLQPRDRGACLRCLFG